MQTWTRQISEGSAQSKISQDEDEYASAGEKTGRMLWNSFLVNQWKSPPKRIADSRSERSTICAFGPTGLTPALCCRSKRAKECAP
jgi:hypothetical protein